MEIWRGLLVFVVAAPGIVFTLLGLAWLSGLAPAERAVSRITSLTFSVSAVAIAAIFWNAGVRGAGTVTVAFGNWFTA